MKQAAAKAERTLERSRTDGCTSHGTGALPHRSLGSRGGARAELAHDSICACSHDEVDAAVLNRYREANTTRRGNRERALKRLSLSLAEACHVAPNPFRPFSLWGCRADPRRDWTHTGRQRSTSVSVSPPTSCSTTTEVRGVLSQIGAQDQMGDGAFVTASRSKRTRPASTSPCASRLTIG